MSTIGQTEERLFKELTATWEKAFSPKQEKVYFLGSGLSALGKTGLPDWNEYVKQLMHCLAKTAQVDPYWVRFVEDLNTQRDHINGEIKDHGLRKTYLENYHMTDILCRRLGHDYLQTLQAFKVDMEGFYEEEPKGRNELHDELVRQMVQGTRAPGEPNETGIGVLGIVTTNFDTCLDNALVAYRRKEKNIVICELKGDYTVDIQTLEQAYQEFSAMERELEPVLGSVPSLSYASRKIVLKCKSFKAFDLISSLMYHIIPTAADPPAGRQDSRPDGAGRPQFDPHSPSEVHGTLSTIGEEDKNSASPSILGRDMEGKGKEKEGGASYSRKEHQDDGIRETLSQSDRNLTKRLPATSFMRFIFNIHGSSQDYDSCIDSNFQREQQLPYGIAQALTSLYVGKVPLTFAGYSGERRAKSTPVASNGSESSFYTALDMNDNRDYLLLESHRERAMFKVMVVDMKDVLQSSWLKLTAVHSKAMGTTGQVTSRLTKESIIGALKADDDKIQFIPGRINLPKDRSEEHQKELDVFSVRLEEHVRKACRDSPIWAALALEDIARALNNATSFFSRDPNTNSIDLSRLKDLRDQLGNHVDGLIKKSNPSLAREHAQPRIEWLTRHQIDPRYFGGAESQISDYKPSGSLITSLVKLLDSLWRDKPVEEGCVEDLHAFASLIERDPGPFPDGWVVWALYIALNYHLKPRLGLCRIYWAKALKTNFFAGNVWGKLAMAYLQENVWKELPASPHRSAIRLHSEPFLINEGPHYQKIHLLGIDNELPVHHHVSVALKEHFRVLLIIGLLYSDLVVLRDSAVFNNRVFMMETLLPSLEPTDDLTELQINRTKRVRSEQEANDQQERLLNTALPKILVHTELCICTDEIDARGALPGRNTKRTLLEARISKMKERDDYPGTTGDFLRDILKEQYLSTRPLLQSRTYPSEEGEISNPDNWSFQRHRVATDTLLKNKDKVLKVLENFLKKVDANQSREDLLQKIEWAESVWQWFKDLFVAFSPHTGNQFWTRLQSYSFFKLTSVDKWEAEVENRIASETSLFLLRENRQKYLATPWRYQAVALLLSNVCVMMDAPTSQGSRDEGVLAINPYEHALIELGCIAYEVDICEKKKLEETWKAYHRIDVAELAYAKSELKEEKGQAGIGRSGSNSTIVSASDLLWQLAEKQLVGDVDPFRDPGPSLAELKILLQDVRSHALLNPHLGKRDKETLHAAVAKLREEFILSSSKSLSPVHQDPVFDPVIYSFEKRNQPKAEGTNVKVPKTPPRRTLSDSSPIQREKFSERF